MKASEFTVHQLLIPSSVEYMVQSVIGRLAIARIEGGWPVVETWGLKVLGLYSLRKTLSIHSLL